MGLTLIKSGIIEDDSITSANIDDATIVTGDIASTTITNAKLVVDPSNASNLNAGSVPAAQLGNAGEYDKVSVQNDIATLALHQAVQNSQVAYNLANAFVDQFEDSTGIDVETNVDNVSKSMRSVYSVTTDPYDAYINGYCASSGASGGHIPTFSTTNNRRVSFGQSTGTGSFISANISGSNSGVYTLEMTIVQTGGGNGPWCTAPGVVKDVCSSTAGWPPTSAYGAYNASTTLTVGHVLKLVYDTDNPNVMTTYVNNGTPNTTRDNTGANWLSIGTPTTLYFLFPCWSDNATPWIWDLAGTRVSTTANATGNWTSTNQTALGTVSKMSIVVLYKNAYGTATLDTDLVAQVSSNGGTNYESAPLTAAGTFSTGILVAKSNDITISNTGTNPKYKISFANQAAASKETQIYGVAILY